MRIVEKIQGVISGFRRKVDELCALLGCLYRVVVIPCRRFGTTYRSHLQGSINPTRLLDPRRRDQIDRPETSARNYHHTLRNMSEECTSQNSWF